MIREGEIGGYRGATGGIGNRGRPLFGFTIFHQMTWIPQVKHKPWDISVLSGILRNLLISRIVTGQSAGSSGFTDSGLVGWATCIFLILVTFECKSLSVSEKCSVKIHSKSLK